jgi:hypothetical protein
MEREIAMKFFKEVERTNKSRIKVYDGDFILSIIEELEQKNIKYTNGIVEDKVADTEAYFIELVERKGWTVDFSMNGIIIKKGGLK